MIKKLASLALIKGFIMAFLVHAITGSIIETAIISFISSTVTGIFLLVNTVIQTKITRNISDKQEHIKEQVDSISARMTDDSDK